MNKKGTYKIKNIIGKIKVKLENYLFYLKHKHYISTQKQEYLLLGTPEYGNLGDHLIALAEKEFLKNSCMKKQIQEITENDIRYQFRKVCKCIDKDTVLIFQGGGNISDIWTDQENIRNKIFRRYPDNRKIVMPQTVYISDETKITQILRKYKDNTLICARERYSYELLSKHVGKTLLCPDIALYLWNKCKIYRDDHERTGIGICIRNDAESLLSGDTSMIIDFLHGLSLESEMFTTVIDSFISLKQRFEKIEQLLMYISNKKLIITDRLHAMIMAYLTGTPCIALANSNGKVEGCYEWISDADNIFFAKSINEGLNKIEDYIGKSNYSNFKYMNLFCKIFESE